MPSMGGGARRLGPEGWVVAVVLGVLAAAVLWQVPAYVAGNEPAGDDVSSHILASTRLAEHLAAGRAGWWMDDLNLGLPLAHFYQPLPHVATAVLALALGGPGQATLAYQLLAALLLILIPIAGYVGFRRFGLAPTGALCSAVALVMMSAPKAYYGLTTRHFLVVGLYTLLWGAVAAPLALGEGARFLRGRGRASLAMAAFALLFFSHGLIAMGLVPVFVFTAVFGGEDGGPTLRERGLRLVALGLGTGVLIAFWLLPQLMCSDYFGGWPTAPAQRADGFGLERVLREWWRGKLTDFHRGPVLAMLSVVGLAGALARLRRVEHRIVVFGVVLFVVFTAGRVTFGSLVDWLFPPNKRIEGMMRWIALVHFFLAISAGLGVQLVVDSLARIRVLRDRPWTSAAALPAVASAALLIATMPRFVKDVDWGFQTFTDSLERPAYLFAAEALRDAPRPGRVFASEETGHGSHWDMAYLALLTGKPMSLSHGVGVQDSLNYYYLTLFHPLEPDDPAGVAARAELFNIRYLVVRPEASLGGLNARNVAQRGSYRVVELPGDYGYFDVIAPPRIVDGKPVELRETFRRWMTEGLPSGASFQRLREPVALAFPSLPSATSDFAETQRESPQLSAAASEPGGRVLDEAAAPSEFRATVSVDADEAWLLLKATPHPFWEARVDGESRAFYTLSPAFMGLALSRGEHSVVFRFRAPAWQKWLLVASPLALLGVIAFERRRAEGDAAD